MQTMQNVHPGHLVASGLSLKRHLATLSPQAAWTETLGMHNITGPGMEQPPDPRQTSSNVRENCIMSGEALEMHHSALRVEQVARLVPAVIAVGCMRETQQPPCTGAGHDPRRDTVETVLALQSQPVPKPAPKEIEPSSFRN